MSENTATVDTSADTADETAEQEHTNAEDQDVTDSEDVTADTTDEQAETKKPEPDNKVDRTEFVKVVKERQDARRKLKEMQAQLDEIKRANEDENERAQREAAEKAASEIEARYKPIVVRTNAKAALVAAGVKEAKVPRLIKLMDLDAVEVDEDGDVSGIAEEVARLQEDYPELFADPDTERPAARSARAADGADKPATRKPLSTTEKIRLGLRGGR